VEPITDQPFVESVTQPFIKLDTECVEAAVNQSAAEPVSLLYTQSKPTQDDEFITGIESDIINNTPEYNNSFDSSKNHLLQENLCDDFFDSLSRDSSFSDSSSMTNNSEESAPDILPYKDMQSNSTEHHLNSLLKPQNFKPSNYSLSMPVVHNPQKLKSTNKNSLLLPVKSAQKLISTNNNSLLFKASENFMSTNKILSSFGTAKSTNNYEPLSDQKGLEIYCDSNNSHTLVSPIKTKTILPDQKPLEIYCDSNNSHTLVSPIRTRTIIRAPVTKKLVFITKNTTPAPIIVKLQLTNGQSIHLKVPPNVIGENIILPLEAKSVLLPKLGRTKTKPAILQKSRKPLLQFTMNKFQQVQYPSKLMKNTFLTVPPVMIPSNYCVNTKDPSQLIASSSATNSTNQVASTSKPSLPTQNQVNYNILKIT
jgi:hypothetical protein